MVTKMLMIVKRIRFVSAVKQTYLNVSIIISQFLFVLQIDLLV